jgi:hypothetical protein
MHVTAVHSVKTIRRVAKELGASVDRLFDVATVMISKTASSGSTETPPTA